MSLTRAQLLEYALTHMDRGDAPDVMDADCRILEYLLDNCEITVPAENRFFVAVNCDGTAIMRTVAKERNKENRQALNDQPWYNTRLTLAATGNYDYGHTSAEWDSVMTLGIYGLRQRLKQYEEKNTDPQKARFYRCAGYAYDAALRFMARAAGEARKAGKPEMADGLEALTRREPQTLYEGLQLTLVYYFLQHYFEGSPLRTMGRLDSLLWPLCGGEITAETDRLLDDYMAELEAQKAVANLPFAIGGTDVDGSSLANPLTYAILKAYQRGSTVEVKLHLLCGKSTPQDLLELAFSGIRKGKNSIVFLSDETVAASLRKIGASPEDAARYHVVGCYECGAYGELPCSCNGRVNIPRALEYAMDNGYEFLSGKQIGLPCPAEYPDFDAFLQEVLRQLRHLCRVSMDSTAFLEQNFHQVHSALFLSSTYTSSVENGGDLYCHNSAKYCNSSINAVGLATAADSLLAIRRLVFEEKRFTLPQLTRLLKDNWQGQELLRLQVKNKFPKYGQGDPASDEMAATLVRFLSETISGRPNCKGGVYRLGLFSIDWRWEMGESTGASADGRLAGEPLSQNSTASFGADRMGTLAHLRSVARAVYDQAANGSVVEIDLHESAVSGENGLHAMCAALRAFFDLGGFSVHYNVLSAGLLREAKLRPEKYPNLQVRLCGWNVLFSALSEKEQDEFIARWEGKVS